MLIDSHAHLNFTAFTDTWRQHATDCLAEDIWVVNIGAQLQTSQRAIEIAEQFDRGMYAMVGLHPTHVLGSPSHPEVFDYDVYKKLAQSSPKVVGIGETGIDFYHETDLVHQQREVFEQHIALAQECDLPVVIHGRNSKDGSQFAYKEILHAVKAVGLKRGVVHCFGGNLAEAMQCIEQGLYIGFTGIVTFKNAQELHEIARQVPLDRILIETDAPYLAPDPYRGKENTPRYVRLVAEQIARLRNIDVAEVAHQTTINAKKLFSIKD